jgi:Arc/MetJ-type ribon-helix-helix transcriptional regulator
MATDLSQDNERFIENQIANGNYSERAEVLNDAVALLRQRQLILAKIDEGTLQLRDGEYSEYDDDSLRARFIQLKDRARKRIESNP